MLTVQYANAFRRRPDYAHVKVNAVTPGYIATDLNNHAGTRTVEQGAKVVIDLALIADNGPSGGVFNEEGVLPWGPSRAARPRSRAGASGTGKAVRLRSRRRGRNSA